LRPSASDWELLEGAVIINKDNLLHDLRRLTPVDGAVIIFRGKVPKGLGRFVMYLQ
jgi:hypothetical protein